MFLLPFLNRDSFPQNTNRKPVLRDCLTRRTGQPAFLLSIQLIYLKVQLVLQNNTTIGNWLRNYVHCCRYRGHLRRILLPLLGLLLLILCSFPSISTVLVYVVGITTFNTLRGCHPCLFHGIGDKLFTSFFCFLSGIGLIGFRTGALSFSLRLLLLHSLVIILLGSFRGFVDLFLLFRSSWAMYFMLKLGPSILLSTPLVFQG